MAKISDELRAAGSRLFLRESDGYGTIMSLADRIDAEMVELPRDKDGKPIHLNDKIYDLNWNEQTALIFELYIERNPTWVERNPTWAVVTDHCKSLPPSELTHTRPDSLERIADELEGLSVDSMVSDTNLLSSCALDLAKRIRRLAEREGKR